MISFARIALFSALVAAIEAQSAYYFSDNTTTPHYSSSECRIRNSTICDPENVLEDNTYELRQLVSSIAAITNRGCASNNYISVGFKVGIAVVKSLPPTGSNLQMIEQIARRVHAKWQLGTCGESIIIASAAAPYNVVYVVAENLAGSSFLSSIRTILDSSRQYFAQSQKIGLQYVLLQIKSVLQNSKLLPGYPVLTSNQNAGLTSAADTIGLSTSRLVLPVIALAYVLN